MRGAMILVIADQPRAALIRLKQDWRTDMLYIPLASMGLVYLPTFTINKTTKCMQIYHTWMIWAGMFIQTGISLRRSYVQMLVPLFLFGHVPTMFCGPRGQKIVHLELEADSLSVTKNLNPDEPPGFLNVAVDPLTDPKSRES